jgi:MFS family permease
MSVVVQGAARSVSAEPLREHSRAHHLGFWFAAAAFLLNMGFSAVPTPLYVLYQRRDHFSTIMITVVYAVYAVGVIASLFLGGHVSDWVGRKRVFVPALLVNVVSAAVFILDPSLTGLIVARILSGISVGLTTATATAYLAELHLRTRWRESRRAEIVAIAANLGGISSGPLVAGLLAEWGPAPLRLPYIVFAAALLVLSALVAFSPETSFRPSQPPAWRPQRIVVPLRARPTFFAATAAGIATFAVYGVFNSLAPGFLAGTLGDRSLALSGAVAFAAFAAGAIAQIGLSRASAATVLQWGPRVLIPGLALLVAGMWVPSLALFIIGGVLTGAGGGLIFRGALVTAASTAPAGSRGEVLAGYFLGAYVGLSVPVIGLGIATEHAPARTVMLYFVIIVAAAILLSTRAALRFGRRPSG